MQRKKPRVLSFENLESRKLLSTIAPAIVIKNPPPQVGK